jgi:hypothetical protein
MNKIRINSPEHSEKVQKHLFSLGITWAYGSTVVQHTRANFLTFDSNYKRILFYYFPSYKFEEFTKHQEVELIEKVSYELKEIPKKEVVTIGEKSYYKDELETALKNINPI